MFVLRPARLTALIAASMFLFGGCGGDDEESSSKVDPPAVTTPPPGPSAQAALDGLAQLEDVEATDDVLRLLDEALGPLSEFASRQDLCFGQDGCGAPQRQDALDKLETFAARARTLADSRPGECGDAARTLADSGDRLHDQIEQPLPADADEAIAVVLASIDQITADANTFADDCT